MLHHAYYWRERSPGDRPGPVALYVKGWGRQGDTAVIAIDDAFPVGAAWYRLFTAKEPGFGFVDERTPELAIAAAPSARGRGGCIPTKAWVQTAHALHAAKDTFGRLGVRIADPTLDFGQANQWKSAVVAQMTGGVAQLFKANGVDWIEGTGRFADGSTITVEGGENVTFRSAVVAT